MMVCCLLFLEVEYVCEHSHNSGAEEDSQNDDRNEESGVASAARRCGRRQVIGQLGVDRQVIAKLYKAARLNQAANGSLALNGSNYIFEVLYNG